MSTTASISLFLLEGLHGRGNMRVSLRPGLNIVYGRNGSGKTTFLHSMANLLHCDLERFTHIRFHRLIVRTTTGDTIELIQSRQGSPERISLAVRLNDIEYTDIVRGDDSLTQHIEHEMRGILGPPPVYLPAFRSIIDATERGRHVSGRAPFDLTGMRSQEEYGRVYRRVIEEERSSGVKAALLDTERVEASVLKTLLCRRWFGPFAPVIKYPSLWEVGRELVLEQHHAKIRVAATDENILSSVFIDVLKATTTEQPVATHEMAHQLRAELETLLGELLKEKDSVPAAYDQLHQLVKQAPVSQQGAGALYSLLSVYKNAITRRMQSQRDAFQQLNTFVSSVNSFWEGKRLVAKTPSDTTLARAQLVQLADGRLGTLDLLSSGERHVLTLLFCATHMAAGDATLLIDEPELSLHIDWQRMILKELMTQAGERQIVACTHSPEVIADHQGFLHRLHVKWSSHEVQLFDLDSPDEVAE